MIKGIPSGFILSVILVGIQLFCLIFLILTEPLFNFHSYGLPLELLSVLLALWAIFVMRASKLNVFPEVRKGSILIKKGPYRIIRHPMYLAVILFAFSLLFVHFTLFRLLIVLALIIDLIVKIEYEEKLLEADLDGYKDYQRNTYKLIPLLY